MANETKPSPEVNTALARLKGLCERLRSAADREEDIRARVTAGDSEVEEPAADGGRLHDFITEAEQTLGRIMRTQDVTLTYL